MKAFITGGAGFIGSALTHHLLKQGNFVTIYDNFSSGRKNTFQDNKNLRVIKGDVLNLHYLEKSLKGSTIVFHFSANADVRRSVVKTDFDLKQGILATYNILEAMRRVGVDKIVFPSSMTVYGFAKNSRPVSENNGPNLPISLYAASKLASEGLISAYSKTFGLQAWILRLANVVGSGMTHGVIFDLINKLQNNKEELSVLGNGTQRKPYIDVEDVVGSTFFLLKQAKDKVNLFNVGNSDTVSVKEIVKFIIKTSKLKNTKVYYEKQKAGWPGDVTEFKLDNRKLRNLGYKIQYNSSQSIQKAINDRLREVGFINEN